MPPSSTLVLALLNSGGSLIDEGHETARLHGSRCMCELNISFKSCQHLLQEGASIVGSKDDKAQGELSIGIAVDGI